MAWNIGITWLGFAPPPAAGRFPPGFAFSLRVCNGPLWRLCRHHLIGCPKQVSDFVILQRIQLFHQHPVISPDIRRGTEGLFLYKFAKCLRRALKAELL